MKDLRQQVSRARLTASSEKRRSSLLLTDAILENFARTSEEACSFVKQYEQAVLMAFGTQPAVRRESTDFEKDVNLWNFCTEFPCMKTFLG